MPPQLDRFREYVEAVEAVEAVEKKKWRCRFCRNMYGGSATRIRAHLAGIPGLGIKGCEKVDPRVKEEARQTFNGTGGSTGGTSGEGTDRFGSSQIVFQSDDTSNPNDTRNSNRPECAPRQPSFYGPTGTGTASACPRNQVSLPPGDMPLDNLDTTQQHEVSNHGFEAARGKEMVSSLQHLELLDSPSELLGLPSFPNDPVLDISRSNGLQEFNGGGIIPDSPLPSTDWSNFLYSPPENLLESCDVIGNTSGEIQTNELHNPTVGSSLQTDSSLDVDRANRLQDCGRPCAGEVVPIRSNTSPTDTVQHPGQLPPRCDKEDGNNTRRFPLHTPVDIDPSTASQHASVVDSLVPEASTNTVGPSSSSHGVSGLIYIATMVLLDP